MIDELVSYNREFVKNKGYEKYITNKYPDKKIAIVSCMDTRLTELLPASLGIKNGDVKIIKNAGAIISHPFGSVIRSLMVAIYELGVVEVMIIGHTDCGAKHMNSSEMIEKMKERGIPQERIDMIRILRYKLRVVGCGVRDLRGFRARVVEQIRNQSADSRSDITVRGFVIDSVTGELTPVE